MENIFSEIRPQNGASKDDQMLISSSPLSQLSSEARSTPDISKLSPTSFPANEKGVLESCDLPETDDINVMPIPHSTTSESGSDSPETGQSETSAVALTAKLYLNPYYKESKHLSESSLVSPPPQKSFSDHGSPSVNDSSPHLASPDNMEQCFISPDDSIPASTSPGPNWWDWSSPSCSSQSPYYAASSLSCTSPNPIYGPLSPNHATNSPIYDPFSHICASTSPSYWSPIPNYDASCSSCPSPSPSYGPHSPINAASSLSCPSPSPSYDPFNTSCPSPRPSFGASTPSSPSPSPSYGPPSPKSAASSLSCPSPSPSYEPFNTSSPSPSPSFGLPSPNYDASRHSYSPSSPTTSNCASPIPTYCLPVTPSHSSSPITRSHNSSPSRHSRSSSPTSRSHNSSLCSHSRSSPNSPSRESSLISPLRECSRISRQPESSPSESETSLALRQTKQKLREPSLISRLPESSPPESETSLALRQNKRKLRESSPISRHPESSPSESEISLSLRQSKRKMQKYSLITPLPESSPSESETFLALRKSKRRFWEHNNDNIGHVKKLKTKIGKFQVICIEAEYIKQNNENRKDLTQIGCSVICEDENGAMYQQGTFFRVIQPSRIMEYLSMKTKGDLLKSLHIQQSETGQFEFRDEFEITKDENKVIKCVSEDKALEDFVDFLSQFRPCILISLDEEVVKIVASKLEVSFPTSPFLVSPWISWRQILIHLNAPSEDIEIDFEDWFVKNMNSEDKISQHPHALDISSMLVKAIYRLVKMKETSDLFQTLSEIDLPSVDSLSSSSNDSVCSKDFEYVEIFNSLRPNLAPIIYFQSVDVIDLSSDSDDGQAEVTAIRWSILSSAHTRTPQNPRKCTNLNNRKTNKACGNTNKANCSFRMCGYCCKSVMLNEPCRGHKRK